MPKNYIENFFVRLEMGNTSQLFSFLVGKLRLISKIECIIVSALKYENTAQSDDLNFSS